MSHLDYNNFNEIKNVKIQSPENTKVITDEFGLFKLPLLNPIDKYPSQIYIFYSKDSLQGKELVRVGQKNVILRFKNE